MSLWYICPSFCEGGHSRQHPPHKLILLTSRRHFYLHGGLGSGLAGTSVNKMSEVKISVKNLHLTIHPVKCLLFPPSTKEEGFQLGH